MRSGSIALALLAVALAACGSASTSARTSTSAENSAPQVLPLATVEQKVAGKPVVFLFRAPGCVSCADQAQALATAAHGRASVQLVGVDLIDDKPVEFAGYIRAIGLAGSQFIWTIDKGGSLARLYGIVSLSSSVFIASDGKIRFLNSGPQDPQTLASQLGQLS